MQEDDQRLEKILETLDEQRAETLKTTVRLLVECCRKGSEMGAVLLVRAPSSDLHWMLSVSALNLDMDDSFELLSMAYHQTALQIKAEAPADDRYN
jgi:hypothetical protein